MISTENISIQFGAKALFQDINITFSKGNKYGLIGANGSGKSTFMKIISGEIEPSNGNIHIDKKYRIRQSFKHNYKLGKGEIPFTIRKKLEKLNFFVSF